MERRGEGGRGGEGRGGERVGAGAGEVAGSGGYQRGRNTTDEKVGGGSA